MGVIVQTVWTCDHCAAEYRSEGSHRQPEGWATVSVKVPPLVDNPANVRSGVLCRACATAASDLIAPMPEAARA